MPRRIIDICQKLFTGLYTCIHVSELFPFGWDGSKDKNTHYPFFCYSLAIGSGRGEVTPTKISNNAILLVRCSSPPPEANPNPGIRRTSASKAIFGAGSGLNAPRSHQYASAPFSYCNSFIFPSYIKFSAGQEASLGPWIGPRTLNHEASLT